MGRISAFLLFVFISGVGHASAAPIDVGTLSWNRLCLGAFATDGTDGLCDGDGGEDTLVFDTLTETAPGDFTSLELLVNGSPFQLLSGTLPAGGFTQQIVASTASPTLFAFPLLSVQFNLPGILSTIPGVFSVLAPTQLVSPFQMEDSSGLAFVDATPFLQLQWEARGVDTDLAPVPEPASLALLGSGLAFVAGRARKLRNRRPL